MDLEEYRSLYGQQDDASPGWQAIDERLHEIYRDQEPAHWGTVIKSMLGGPDPIDGISAYKCPEGGTEHLHFVTYGYSSLYYDEESVGKDFSGYGFEMTFRLATQSPPAEAPMWVCSLLQNIARYVFETGKWFENYHWMPANGPICADSDTDLVGLAFLTDPTLGAIDTPHGRVEFIQAFGITQNELDSLTSREQNCEHIIERHRKINPLLITDLSRKNSP